MQLGDKLQVHASRISPLIRSNLTLVVSSKVNGVVYTSLYILELNKIQ